jgi:hypothetical protein
VPYSEFIGGQGVTETTYEYEGDLLVRAVTVAEPRWTDTDRGLLLALLAERRETCSQCGHPMSQCRDKKTAGTWQVITDVCYPTQVAQARARDIAKEGRNGVVLSTRRT